MHGHDKSTEVIGQSKFSRMKDSIERGRVMRAPSLDLTQLRRPSSFFKSSSRFSSHKKKDSISDISELTKSLQLTPSKSAESHRSLRISASPEIATVSNFSPTRSINSNNAASVDNSPIKQPYQPIQSETTSIPSISIIKDSTVDLLKPSKFSRLKRRTLSKLFDQNGQQKIQQSTNSIKTELSGNSSEKNPVEFSKTDLVRPQLSKALSDSKQVMFSTSDEVNVNPLPEKELMRNRSRTVGSIENEIYSRKGTSFAKTIGSMVMLRQRQSTTDSLQSSDNGSEGSSGSFKIPEHEEGETEEEFIQKLLDEGLENEISSILSEKKNDFMQRCLVKFIKDRFKFEKEPLDVSLRRFLMLIELPKETQQIDRVLSIFSERYYEDNSKIWDNPDQIYFVTFSLVMLHTDHFNANNKKKMTKEEFIKNTFIDNSNPRLYCPIVSKEILEYFYDNITFVRFIQKSKPIQQQALYSLPKRIFSSASTTNLDALNISAINQQPNLNTTRSYSLSSSTSQFFSSNQIDPYPHIIENEMESLKLNLGEIQEDNPFSNRLNTVLPESIKTYKENLVQSGGLYLRFNKNINWLAAKSETKFTNEGEFDEENFNILKVIKVAELYREETIKNNKFFTIVSTSRVIWKKCYGILTTCGLFIFDNLNFLAISDRQKILDEDATTSTESTIIDIGFEQILRSCSKLSINGLFAVPTLESTENSYCFNVYSTNKKEMFSNSTNEEMENWILAINFIAALDSCFMDSIKYENREVTSIRNITIEDKIHKLSKNVPELTKKVQEIISIQHHLNILTPFQVKTKENLINYYKTLEKRLDWLWYEIGRNEVYVNTLEKETQNNEYRDKVSIRTDNDNESFLEDSFINEDYLHKNYVNGNSRLVKAGPELIKERFSVSLEFSTAPVKDYTNDDRDEYFDALNDNL